MKRNRWWTAVIALVVIAFVAFLILRETAQTVAQQRSVSIRLLWLNQAQFSGIYSANEEGYYASNNLRVRIAPGGPGINPILMVAAGSEDFGIASGTDIILAREKGIPVKALAVFVPDNPTSFFARKESHISTVKDFVGKKVGVKTGFELEYYLKAMLRHESIPESAVQLVPIQFDLSPFFRGDVDVWCGYRINEPNLVRERGIEINEIFPSDYGVKVVGDVLFTSEEFFANNEDVAWSFTDATWRGWQFANENPERALMHVMKYNDKGDVAHEREMLRSMLALVFPAGRSVPQVPQSEEWEVMSRFLSEMGITGEPVEASTCFWIRK